MFQSPCLMPWLIARQNVELGASQGAVRRTRREIAAAAHHYLELVGVADAADQLPTQISLGTQQCVSLARALAVEPRFLLLDEPFSQLDSLTRFDLQDILLRVWERSGQDRGDGDARRRRGALPRGPAHSHDRRPRGVSWRGGDRSVSAAAITRHVLGHPRYHACRRRVIDFLEHHAHQSKPSALDDVLQSVRSH